FFTDLRGYLIFIIISIRKHEWFILKRKRFSYILFYTIAETRSNSYYIINSDEIVTGQENL
ncbi:hypothetical protein ACJX0J_017341, partial [Zea mays]